MYKLSCRKMQILSCTINRKNGREIERKKFVFYPFWREREKKNKNVRKRRHWPRVSATIAWKIWISRNRPGSIKFPTTTIRGICKCLFFLFYLDIVLSRSVRRVKPFPASYATASFILFPIKKNKPKVQCEKTMSRRYIGVYQASSPFHLFPIVSPQRDSKFHVDLENSRNGGRFGEEEKKKKKKIEKMRERRGKKKDLSFEHSIVYSQWARTFSG